jgi:putative ABC transport system permease protein
MSLEPGQLAALRGIAGIEGLSLSRTLRVPSDFGELGLRAAAPGPDGWGLQVVRGGMGALEDERISDAIAISEPLAYRLDTGVGQRLSLATPDGPHSFTVAAVFRDYNAGGSGVLIALAAYRQYWRDSNLSGIGVHLVDDDDEPAVKSAIGALLPGAPESGIRSSAAIEEISMRIFDRTFQITEVLRFLAGLIAFLGVLSAMLAIQLERGRELAILRGLGFGPRGLAIQVLAQTGLLGLCAGLAALPLGAGLAAVLVHVINRRSFGWTMELGLAAEPLGMGVGLAVAAALLAGIYPAWRSARTGLEAALRDE